MYCSAEPCGSSCAGPSVMPPIMALCKRPDLTPLPNTARDSKADPGVARIAVDIPV